MADTDKTEKATPRRQKKAREQGRVVRSREVGAALVALTGLWTLLWVSPAELQNWRASWRQWTDLAWECDFSSGTRVLTLTALAAFRWVGPSLVLVWLLAVMSSVAQGGFVFSTEPLIPNFERLSPPKRLQQLFSMAGLAPVAKSLVPFSVLVYIGLSSLVRDWQLLTRSAQLSISSIGALAYEQGLEICWKSTLVLLLWSAIDYLLQRQKLESDLRMSKQEIREEFKETDGNPTVKTRLRRLQRQLRRRRMLKDIERSTVIITNPTHFAVALEYNPTMAAPVVVGKGVNSLAEQIKQKARWYSIPIIENPSLAQALYRTVEIGETIPAKLYAAVAEILAFIYRAQLRAQQAVPQR